MGLKVWRLIAAMHVLYSESWNSFRMNLCQYF